MPKPRPKQPTHPPTPSGSLRVWWHPPDQTELIYIPVVNLSYAQLALRVFLLCTAPCEHRAVWRGGLEVFDGTDWSEWHNADGNDIRWVMADAEAA